MKALLTLYALAMLAIIGLGFYHAPWWLIASVLCPVLGIIAWGLVDDYRRARERGRL